MTCANVLVGLGKIVKGWRLAMLDGRMEVRLSASLPRRERLHHHQPVLREPCISIHAPAKGATACKRSLSMCAAAFQSTLPRRERRITSSFSSHRARFQSTLPRRERRRGGARGACRGISIHAPAKGATAKITKTIPDDFRKINNYNNSFAQICAKHNCKFDIR